MPNNLDMGGFGSPGLPVRATLNGDVSIAANAHSAGPALFVGVPSTNASTAMAFDVKVPGSSGSLLGVNRNGVARAVRYGDSNGNSAGGLDFLAGSTRLLSYNGEVCLTALNGGAGLFSSGIAAWGANYFTPDAYIYRDAANVLNHRNGTTAQTSRLTRSYTDSSNYSWLTQKWNTTTAVIHAEGAGTGSDGSVAFNDAALATGATVGFVMLPSCAGTPTGVPADIPTGQIPLVWDSTNLKLYAYTGGAWKASAAFT